MIDADRDASLPHCLACGACCFSTLPEAVRVTGDDHARLGDDAERYATFIGHRCYMRIEDGHCAALEVTPEGAFACRVYERRPEVCRAVERASPACNAERWEKLDRTVVALARVRRSATLR
ncbi:MAG: YkgJ family cysteine cluster protein [Polyangiales bacterium]